MLETVITAAVTAALTALTTFMIQERRLRREFRLDLQRVRTEFVAEQVAKELLESPNWQKRSFNAIQRRLGGFSDDTLRQILVRAGAVRFEGQDDEELWGLLSRNRDSL